MRLLFTLLLFLPFYVHAAALMTGVVFMDINLLDTPDQKADVITSLTANSPITVNKRQGQWAKVTASDNTGWVPTLVIRVQSVTKQDNGEQSIDTINRKMAEGGAASVVATMGIRGLDEEALKEAEFNKKQLVLLEGYQVNDKQLTQFASSGKLKSKEIDYLIDPTETEAVDVAEVKK
jgi:SH3 domain-containing protein